MSTLSGHCAIVGVGHTAVLFQPIGATQLLIEHFVADLVAVDDTDEVCGRSARAVVVSAPFEDDQADESRSDDDHHRLDERCTPEGCKHGTSPPFRVEKPERHSAVLGPKKSLKSLIFKSIEPLGERQGVFGLRGAPAGPVLTLPDQGPILKTVISLCCSRG